MILNEELRRELAEEVYRKLLNLSDSILINFSNRAGCISIVAFIDEDKDVKFDREEDIIGIIRRFKYHELSF